MKKLILLSILVLGAGALFQGCMITDHPYPAIVADGGMECHANCGGDTPPSGWIDLVMGTEGPSGSVYPDERGEYWFIIQPLKSGEVSDACLWDAGGGGGSQRIDTFWNPAGAYAVGCPPSYLCYWQVGITWGGYGAVCPPDPTQPVPASFCNLGNGACRLNPYGFGGPTFDPGPGAFLNKMYYLNKDDTPGPPCEFDMNQKREPGDWCPDCDGAMPTPGDDHKTLICHTPRGNPDNAHTISIDVAAVPAHLAHGDPADSVGRGCGTGPSGEGLQVPAGNIAPAWGAATCFYVDYANMLVEAALPWTDNYGAGNGMSASAAEDLFGILRNNPVGDGGLVNIGISQVKAPGETVDFSSPLSIDVKLNFENGHLEQMVMMDAHQPALTEAVRFLLDNTPSSGGVDLTGWTLTLTSGDVIKGSTLMKATGQSSFAIGHERLSKALEDFQTLSGSVEPTRLENPRISRR